MPRYKEFPFQPEKFRELIVYIAKHCEGDPTFGSIKLNKVLYYSDFSAYRILGEPITGATYRKLSEGPAPRQLLAQRRTLEDAGDIAVVLRPYFSGVQKRITVAKGREPEVGMFDPRELVIVDEVIAFFWGKTAREVSDYSHEELGWMVTEFGEDIPYETAWVSKEPPTDEVETSALEMLKKRG